MSQQYINVLLLAGAFLLLFGTAEFLYHKMKIKVEITRKIVHLGTGLLTLLFPAMLDNHWLVLFLCASFAVILVISMQFNFLKSVNAIDRKSRGSILYPVSVYCCYFFYQHYGFDYLYYYIPILILAISDPVAALVGKRWPYGKYKVWEGNKTIMGSAMFFVSTFVICIVLFAPKLTGDASVLKKILACFLISLLTTFSEALSGKGYDNITIPFSALFTLIIMQNYV